MTATSSNDDALKNAGNFAALAIQTYIEEIHAAFHRCGAQYVIGYAADFFLESRNI